MEDDDKLIELFEYVRALEIEEDDYLTLNDEFKEEGDLVEAFRNSVMIIHKLTEIRLDNLLTFYLSGKWIYNLGEKAQENLKKKRIIFNRMEFYNKVKALEDIGLFSGKLANRILTINNIRVWFAHPSAYEEKILKYKDREKIIKDLEILLKFIMTST